MRSDPPVRACNNLLSKSLEQVESLLSAVYTDHPLERHVNDMCMHVIKAGGKRMRPRLVLLSAFALPDFDPARDLDSICHIAASIELLHTATLVHDDVIDKAPMRRGQSTLNETEGNHAAVLAGDYLFTRCFDLLQHPRNFEIITELSRTLRKLVVGELYQLEHEGDVNLSLETYFDTIYHKTGVLFELASCAPAITLARSQYEPLIAPLKEFGRKLGVAFQIKDDMLDYSADSTTLGKDAGTDLNDQRITLPVLVALQRKKEQPEGGQAACDALLSAINAADFAAVRQAIDETDALAVCEKEAQKACDEAIATLSVLPESEFKAELIALCHKAIQRQH